MKDVIFMKCPNCNGDVAENAAFCGECGYNFSSDDIMGTLNEEKNSVEKKEESKKPQKNKSKKNNKNKKKTADKVKKKSSKNIKVAFIIVFIVLVVAALLYVLSLFSSKEGEKILKNVPIGRDISYAETQTERTFTTISEYYALKTINNFDSLCESDKSVNIEGINLPEWAIAVSLADDKTIDRVSYYDFTQLQKTWKGYHSSSEIATSAVEYGMTEKEVERKLGFSPYTIIKGIDNTTTYVYRYYHEDELTGDAIVYNYFVVFNDVNNNVKNVYVSKLNFEGLMLSVE